MCLKGSVADFVTSVASSGQECAIQDHEFSGAIILFFSCLCSERYVYIFRSWLYIAHSSGKAPTAVIGTTTKIIHCIIGMGERCKSQNLTNNKRGSPVLGDTCCYSVGYRTHFFKNSTYSPGKASNQGLHLFPQNSEICLSLV